MGSNDDGRAGLQRLVEELVVVPKKCLVFFKFESTEKRKNRDSEMVM